MKKIVSILLMILYTVSVSASVVHVRYCGETIKNVSVLVTDTMAGMPCCCADMKMASSNAGKQNTDEQGAAKKGKSCCSDQVIQLRAAFDQIGTEEIRLVMHQVPTQALTRQETAQLLPVWLCRNETPLPSAFEAPPPPIPLYKLFQRYTYYG